MSVDPNILSPAAFHILIALADGNKHGYAVMKEVSTATAGEVQRQSNVCWKRGSFVRQPHQQAPTLQMHADAIMH